MQDNAIEENTHIPEKELKADDDKRDDYIKNFKKSKKKWKRVNSNYSSLVLRFIIVLLLVETFFLYTYFSSESFLSQVSQLTSELRLLISRQPNLTNLLLMEKELFYSNNSSLFLFKPVKEVVEKSYND